MNKQITGKNARREFGMAAEALAAQWYLRQYAAREARLLGQNYWCKGGEIDLIFEERAWANGPLELVFVEVRARSPGGFVCGLESVNGAKRRRVKRAIQWFLMREYEGSADSLRCDVLAWDGRKWSHSEDAFGQGAA